MGTNADSSVCCEGATLPGRPSAIVSEAPHALQKALPVETWAPQEGQESAVEGTRMWKTFDLGPVYDCIAHMRVCLGSVLLDLAGEPGLDIPRQGAPVGLIDPGATGGGARRELVLNIGECQILA